MKQAAEIAVAELCQSSSASLVQNDADCYVSFVVCFCCDCNTAGGIKCKTAVVCRRSDGGHQCCSSDSSEERKKS